MYVENVFVCQQNTMGCKRLLNNLISFLAVKYKKILVCNFTLRATYCDHLHSEDINNIFSFFEMQSQMPFS